MHITETQIQRTSGYSEKRDERTTRLGYKIERHKLLLYKIISNEDSLHSTGKYCHYFIINFNGVVC